VNLIIASVIALISRAIFTQILEPELAGLASMGVLAVVTLASAIISVRQVKGF
jgi:hypothetical protein